MQLEERHTRDIGLDITRIVAFASVPSIHFFLNSGFYNAEVIGIKMYLMVATRTLFTICVPLFMLISGYLLSNKKTEITKAGILHYYSKLGRVIATYMISVIVIVAFRIVIQQEELSVLKTSVSDIVSFNYYSWYIEMYIGLYLLTPFLNKLWHIMEEKDARKALVAVLLIVTILPSFLNLVSNVLVCGDGNKNILNWWTGLYPITYYYIGAYIRSEVDVKKLNTIQLTLLMILCVGAFTVINCYKSYSINFVWGEWNSWHGFENVIDAVLVFLIINSINYRKPSQLAIKATKFISNLTLGAYLLSWIPDHYFYPKLIKVVPQLTERFRFFPLMVGKTIIASLLLSFSVYIVVNTAGAICQKRRIQ